MKNLSFFRTILFIVIVMLIQSGYGQVRLPRLVSDGMVLQRDTNVNVWGWAAPGEKIAVRFLGKTYSTEADGKGEWKVILSPMKAGGPYAMEIDASNHIVLKNILIGDVWLCSGQSNMVLPMERVAPKYEKEIASSYNPDIRQFLVPQRYDFNGPRSNVQWASWEEANPWSLLHFSAAAYFFAKSLYKKYHVPIGLINAAVGGTPIEAWMSRDALKKFPEALETVDKFKSKTYIDSIEKADNAKNITWYNHVFGDDEGLTGETEWYDENFNDSSWSTFNLPGVWADEGLKNINGAVWFRREFNVPASMTGKQAELLLGRIVDADYAYINGIFVGSVSYQYPPRRYEIAPGILKAGKNVIAVRVLSTHSEGAFIPDKPYKIIEGKHSINLAGQWKYKIGVRAGTLADPTFIQYMPVGLFNGMISPLLGYTIKGAIWYQGESDCWIPKRYYEKFTSMITDWRNKWSEGDFPFIFVQLPNYGPAAKEPPEQSGWAEIREAQLKTLSLPNTGMAVTVDIGEWNDIHPLDKGDVGKRLALAAEKVAYHDAHVIYSGPIFRSMKISNGRIIISFSNTGSGLKAKGGKGLKGFSIAGSDMKFVWAKAKIVGNKVVVWNESIKSPEAVRYAWADNPAGANLYNKENLPASPFRTDK